MKQEIYQDREAIKTVLTNPSVFGKAILTGFENQFTRVNQQLDKGDYFSAGKEAGELAVNIATTASAGYGLAKTGISAASKLSIRGLDLAIDSLVSVSRALPAVEHGVVTFQYHAAKSVVCATQEIQRATKVPKTIVKANIVDAASSSSSSTMANLTKEVVAELKPKTKGVSELQLSNKGIHKPEPLLPQELAKVEEWQHARNQYLKAQREADISVLQQNLQNLLENANQSIVDKFTPDTMAAVIKETRGVKIYDEKTGKLLNHKIKWQDANKSITKALKALQDRMEELMERGLAISVEGQVCQENLTRLSNTKGLYTKLIEEATCHNKLQGPKP